MAPARAYTPMEYFHMRRLGRAINLTVNWHLYPIPEREAVRGLLIGAVWSLYATCVDAGLETEANDLMSQRQPI